MEVREWMRPITRPKKNLQNQREKNGGEIQRVIQGSKRIWSSQGIQMISRRQEMMLERLKIRAGQRQVLVYGNVIQVFGIWLM